VWPDAGEKNVNDLTINTHPCVRCAFFALFRPKWPKTRTTKEGQSQQRRNDGDGNDGGDGGVGGGGDGKVDSGGGDDDVESGRYWGKLMRSRIAHAPAGTLGCLKIRTGYPENPMCFPDDVPRTAACVEAALKQPPCMVAYLQHMVGMYTLHPLYP
jgi:hypothetical protein